jgi:hypothetical protein
MTISRLSGGFRSGMPASCSVSSSSSIKWGSEIVTLSEPMMSDRNASTELVVT